MTQTLRASTSRTWTWAIVLIALLAARAPSLVQPSGGDQGLYTYVGQRIAQGDVPYRDAWEQKPPAIFYVYSALWSVWPHESVVAAADLIAAGLIAWLLVGLGRVMFGGHVGEGAAAMFLVLGDPGIQRLAGMNVRAQCETFIALAVTAAVILAWRSDQRPARLALAGVALGIAFWLKYNAIVYAAPIALAAAFAPAAERRAPWPTVAWVAGGAAAVFGAGIAWFASVGALPDMWLATIAYNVRYSGETYRGALDPLRYLVTFPVVHARVDGLWFAGGLGAACLFLLRRADRAALVALAWTAAACLSIAVNGSRGLPQYFPQAAPALALAGAAGLAYAWRQRGSGARTRWLWGAAVLMLLAGAWRVGAEPSPRWQPRLFGLPQLAANIGYDLRHLTGAISRQTYLERFGRGDLGKYSPLAVERLAEHLRSETDVRDAAYVFGFASGGVLAKSGRRSASRFFWSRPVILEFAADRPGYGSAGLLQDLQRHRPAMVALQKHDWGLAEANVADSRVFFLETAPLREWLNAGYVADYEDAAFVVWRRKG